jgi:NAD(P)-dependent dehydrogenase (short-subunit alcohol dehydrogenase family)
VNSIVPGPVADTEGLNRLAPDAQSLEAMRERVPLRRLGRIDDISRMALLLASEWCSYVTGAVIPVDGGLSLTGPRDFAGAHASARAS